MIRTARPEDMPAITDVRTSVAENHLSVEQMAARGITPEKVIAEITAGDLGAWVAEEDGEVVAFSMADRRDASIFALFTAPGSEGRGHGSALLAGRKPGSRAWVIANSGCRPPRQPGREILCRQGLAADGRRPDPPGDIVFRKTLAN